MRDYVRLRWGVVMFAGLLMFAVGLGSSALDLPQVHGEGPEAEAGPGPAEIRVAQTPPTSVSKRVGFPAATFPGLVDTNQADIRIDAGVALSCTDCGGEIDLSTSILGLEVSVGLKASFACGQCGGFIDLNFFTPQELQVGGYGSDVTVSRSPAGAVKPGSTITYEFENTNVGLNGGISGGDWIVEPTFGLQVRDIQAGVAGEACLVVVVEVCVQLGLTVGPATLELDLITIKSGSAPTLQAMLDAAAQFSGIDTYFPVLEFFTPSAQGLFVDRGGRGLRATIGRA